MEKELIREYRGKIPEYLLSQAKKIVYVCSSNRNIADYSSFLRENFAGALVRVESAGDNEEKEKNNYDALDALKTQSSYIVLLSLEGYLRDFYRKGDAWRFALGETVKRKDLEEKLIQSGYEKKYMVEKRKEYSIRGDIVDIYPISGEYPVRLEFFDEIPERITHFDPESQRSIKKHEKLDVYIHNNNAEPLSFLDFLTLDPDPEKAVFFENLELLAYKFEEMVLKNREDEELRRERFMRLYEEGREIELLSFPEERLEQFRSVEAVKALGSDKNISVELYTYEEMRYRELLKNSGVKIHPYRYFEGFSEKKGRKERLVLTDRELKGIKISPREEERRKLRYIDVSRIRENDYIIHKNFGVGVYLGIEVIDGRDYLKIRYADEDRLFVPVESIKNIEKYVSTPGEIPEIYRLGRHGFRRKKEKLKEEMIKFAKEIIEIQARREKERGFVYSPDTVWQEEFEEGFPYKETASQLKAINDVKKDMEEGRIMDRVICGDVGYGKTEIALRAAFKAVTDGKQVAILVPTTVLAEQHDERFTERFSNYPITVACMSRLKTKGEQAEILKKVKSGTVDILIGTHRILSDDLDFHDLGLVVIDEEQKFGVKAKEKLKKLRTKVSVLTMTATPIPRTLNLSLLGIRDISIIDTPPEGRKPIETVLIEKEDALIKAAVMREIAREGQVFYIYNYVRGMEEKAAELRAILPPYVRLDYIHGQMQPREIKRKISAFENGDLDVLLSTTIIENGIDIENANAMIIEGIEKLGLSQIYQLRGRIGRGERKAHCYLVNALAGGKKVREREESIKELKDVGGGFQLSLEDMRIRGAGEILGEKQHGALETFGYNMYIKMLKEEMAKLKGEYREERDMPEIKVLNHGYIPDSYIEKDEKIVIYKRMVEIEDEAELQNLLQEIEDRFGPAPEVVGELFSYLSIKMKAEAQGIALIEERDEGYFIRFDNTRLNDNKRTLLINLVADKKAQYHKALEGILYRGTLDAFFAELENPVFS